jgi:anaerobic selenocysteine-containing dehydrogenase
VQYGAQVLPAQGEAWPNYRLVAELAQRLGLQDPVFQRSIREHIASLLDVAEGPLAGMTLETVLDGLPHRLRLPSLGHTFDHVFPTATGKLQIASPELAARGLPDLPDYGPQVTALSPHYPLRLVTAPGHHLHHSSFMGVASLRRREGGPWARLHPTEASRRGIAPDQPVELFNEAGAVGLYAKITTDVPEGIVVVEGHRPQSHYLSGGPLNVLCADRLSDLGEGATYQDTWLQVRPMMSIG